MKIELLEQSLRDMNNGLWRRKGYMTTSFSDDHLHSDYADLKSKVEEQQRIIEEQNEMLDEAQQLMQQLKVGIRRVLSCDRVTRSLFRSSWSRRARLRNTTRPSYTRPRNARQVQ